MAPKRRRRKPEPITYGQVFRFYAWGFAYLALCSLVIESAAPKVFG